MTGFKNECLFRNFVNNRKQEGNSSEKEVWELIQDEKDELWIFINRNTIICNRAKERYAIGISSKNPTVN